MENVKLFWGSYEHTYPFLVHTNGFLRVRTKAFWVHTNPFPNRTGEKNGRRTERIGAKTGLEDRLGSFIHSRLIHFISKSDQKN